ncbi:MAG: DUF3307 domain-containing protein [Oceanipulchritudo sp.]
METLLCLLTAHLIGDFILQTDWMVRNKRNAAVLLGHVGIVTILTLLLLGSLHWPILIVIFLLHFLIDAIKAFGMEDTLESFLIDQGLHLATIGVLAVWFPYALFKGWWPLFMDPVQLGVYLAILSFLSCLILILPVGGILIGKVTQPFLSEIEENEIQGLRRGGRYIGYLERFLILLLVGFNQAVAIGFLLATKSILRFGEIKNGTHRKMAEYIIIGTFLSFGWAFLIATLGRSAVLWWIAGIQ